MTYQIMKKLLSTLKQKWAEYLLEMIVITAGILGAFALNNWNESRAQQLRDENVLLEIYSNLNQDFETLGYDSEEATEQMELYRFLLDSARFLASDTLGYLLEQAHRITEWEPLTVGYNSFVESRSDNEVSDSLSLYIAYFYRSALRKTNRTSAKDISLFGLNQYRGLLIDHGFPMTSEEDGLRPISDIDRLSDLVEDKRFEGIIRHYQYAFGLQRKSYDGRRERIEELLIRLEKYFDSENIKYNQNR